MAVRGYPFTAGVLLALAFFTSFFARATEQTQTPELTFYLVRHGQTWSNIREMTVCGGGNAPLTDKGRYDARSLGLGLADVPFIAAYSSTLGRAIETAGYIVERRNLSPVRHLEDLKDIGWGEAEGGTVDELTQRFGHSGNDFLFYFGRWDDAHFHSPVKAETMYQFRQRFDSALRSIAQRHQGQSGNVLVVAHSSLGFYLQQFRGDAPLAHLSNTSVSVLKYRSGRFQLVDFNNSDYLQRGREAMEAQGAYHVVLLANPLTLLHQRGVIEGLTDSDYTQAGLAANQTLNRRFHDIQPAAIWSSRLRRADKMAHDVFAGRRVAEVAYDDRLNELFVGQLEATPLADLAADSALVSRGQITHFSPAKTGESGQVAAWRLQQFLNETLPRYTPQQGPVMVFTHPYIMRAFAERYVPGWRDDNSDGVKIMELNVNNGIYSIKQAETIKPR